MKKLPADLARKTILGIVYISCSSSWPFSLSQAFAFSIVGVCVRTMFQNLGG
jgi:hypothetical protein